LLGQTCQAKTIFSPGRAATALRKSVCLPSGTKSSQLSTTSRQPYSRKKVALASAHWR